jgi:hypothetical protein
MLNKYILIKSYITPVKSFRLLDWTFLNNSASQYYSLLYVEVISFHDIVNIVVYFMHKLFL